MAVITRCKNGLAKTVTKTQMVKAALASAAMTSVSLIAPVLCLDPDSVNMDTVVGYVIGIVAKIGIFVGAVLLAFAIFQLVLAFKDEDANAKSRNAQLLVVAIALMGIKPLLSGLFSLLGITITVP